MKCRKCNGNDFEKGLTTNLSFTYFVASWDMDKIDSK